MIAAAERVRLVTPGEKVPAQGLAVAVDVIRFATTAAVLLAERDSIHLGPAEEAAIAAWRGLDRHGLVFAERGGVKLAAADFDNSPAEALELAESERPILLCSSNGAPLSLSLPAGRTWVAGFANLTATARLMNSLLADSDKELFLFSASPGFEDDWCCRAIRDLVLDPDLTAEELTGGPEALFDELRRISPRSEADLRLCAAVDRYDFALRLEAKIERTYGLLSRQAV